MRVTRHWFEYCMGSGGVAQLYNWINIKYFYAAAAGGAPRPVGRWGLAMVVILCWGPAVLAALA
jgi:hypothetical protein